MPLNVTVDILDSFFCFLNVTLIFSLFFVLYDKYCSYPTDRPLFFLSDILPVIPYLPSFLCLACCSMKLAYSISLDNHF